jgi:hypothetical protein
MERIINQMIKSEENITLGTKEGQAILFFISITLVIIFLFFFLFEQSFSMLVLFLIEVTLLFIANFSFRNFYDVKVKDKNLILENFWGNIRVPRKELTNISSHIFFFPYPQNPFVGLHFINAKKITSKLSFPFGLNNRKEQSIQNLYHKIKEGLI